MAVSGGPDSLALLLLATAALPGRVHCATVDHGLRAASAGEAQFVGQCCAELGVAHTILPVTIPPGNVADRARAERYRALGGWAAARGLARIATAHHADDQAETLTMRLNRGSGVAGLAGIRPGMTIAGVAVIRPLLGWRREALAQVVAARGWKAVDDPSNRDPASARARMRQRLATAGWLDPAAIAASAGHLADADVALDWAVEHILAERIAEEDGCLAMPDDLPRALALRVIARLLDRIGKGAPRGSEIARLHAGLLRGEVATLAGVVVRPGKRVWRFAKAPPRQERD